MRIGAYEIKARLGRGGMGEVNLAQHVATGEVVALKRVRDPDRAQIASLRREIAALLRYQHPNIVRLVEHGTVDGLPWCALELVEGITLQGLLTPEGHVPTYRASDDDGWGDEHETPATRDAIGLDPAEEDTFAIDEDGLLVLPWGKGRHAATPPPSDVVRRGLSAILRVCAPLAFLHEAGVAHCDLKPSNLVLRPDDSPVIIDFGLMVHFRGSEGRERLDAAYQPIGTYEYMAPERAKRELTDARSDLYALGCVLYEILTGQPPFVGDPRSILRHHVEVRPVPPSGRVPDVPAILDELVMNLLEKDPRKRIDRVEAVADALAACGACDDVSERPSRPSTPDLHRPKFAGPSTVVRELSAKDGGFVLVGGEQGAGKTRFAMEIARIATSSRRVVESACLPQDASEPPISGSPLHPLRAIAFAIADECRSQGPGMTELLFGRNGRVLAEWEPAFLELPEVAESPALPVLSKDACDARLFAVLWRAIAGLGQMEPLVWVVDDLHLADEKTLRFLASLDGQKLVESHVLLLGMYRTDAVPERLRAIMERRDVISLALPKLDRGAIGALAADMLSIAEVPQDLLDALIQASGGKPLVVTELLRTAAREGRLERDSDGGWSVTDPPPPPPPSYNARDADRAHRDSQ